MHNKARSEQLWERESEGFLDDVDRLKQGYSNLNGLEVKLSTYLEGSTRIRGSQTPKSAQSTEIAVGATSQRISTRNLASPKGSNTTNGCCYSTYNNKCGSTRATTYSTDSRALQDHRRDSGFRYRQSYIEDLQRKADNLKYQNTEFSRGTPGRVLTASSRTSRQYPPQSVSERHSDRYLSNGTSQEFQFVPPIQHRESVLQRYNTSVETNYFGMERSLAGEITKMARGFEEEKDHLLDLIQTQARMIHDLQSQQMTATRPKSVRFSETTSTFPKRNPGTTRTYYAWAN